MRWIIRISCILLFALAVLARDPLPVPHIKRAEPDTAKAGAVVTVFGENLDKSRVTEVYLTDSKNDVQVKILAQAADYVKFEVPAKIAAGRYCVMVLMPGDQPTLLEQPVSITVE